ncbi:STAS domain-containing protein [Pseudidiomarina homiensis]|uniref:STAS domain-containing protein n=1 Tax=Pseudidiomarina homiensis TaxID=364198 RepID=UPI00215ABFA6|nr:STAS domain-containing protein [Pseudidiomarina homiensis]
MTEFSWQQHDGKLIFSGELTRATVPQAWQERAQWHQGEQQLTVDLAALEHVDSAGVAMLLQLKKYLLEKQCELTISKPSQQFKAIVDVSGATDLLAI